MFSVSNDTQCSWEIHRIETSCECVSVEARSRHVPVGQAVALSVSATFEDDPAFQGSLSIRATIRDGSGKELGYFDILLDVVSHSTGPEHPR